MPLIKPVTRRALLTAVTGFAICARLPHAAAQNEGNHNNQRRISIAVQEFPDGSASDVSSRDLTTTTLSELKASDRFVFVEPPGKPVEDNVNVIPQFEKWRSIHTDCLVTGRIIRKPDQRIFVEFRLWDVTTGHQLIGAQYLLQLDDWRRVPHAIAESILDRLVG